MQYPSPPSRAGFSHSPSRQRGFTLVEMIMVIVITGIIGGMVAVFLNAPVQQYVDVARRAEMSDIADTALRRVNRDLRLALPNSVRVSPDGLFIEFLPTTGGGRYRAGAPGDELDFSSAADNSFDVLGPGVDVANGDSIVIYNLGITGADAYDGSSRRSAAAPFGNGLTNVTFAPGGIQFPFDSPGHRFHVVATPVTYACDGAGTLWRYWGYGITPAQPNGINASNQLLDKDGNVLANQSRARLATNVSLCSFAYDGFVVAQRSGLVTMRLGIMEQGETVTLYSATHVSNQP